MMFLDKFANSAKTKNNLEFLPHFHLLSLLLSNLRFQTMLYMLTTISFLGNQRLIRVVLFMIKTSGSQNRQDKGTKNNNTYINISSSHKNERGAFQHDACMRWRRTSKKNGNIIADKISKQQFFCPGCRKEHSISEKNTVLIY
jgi:hypothetical protein